METVAEIVIKSLPNKIINKNGNNFYLVLEMCAGNNFVVFYRNSDKSEETAECEFNKWEENPLEKVEEMLIKLHDLGFRIFSPKIHEEFSTSAPRLPL